MGKQAKGRAKTRRPPDAPRPTLDDWRGTPRPHVRRLERELESRWLDTRPVLDCYVGALPGCRDEPWPMSDCGDEQVDAILNAMYRRI